MRIARSSLKWRIKGRVVSEPTLDQLHALQRGDFAMVVPPPSKADQFGVFFGGRPLYFPFVPNSITNAAHALAQLELKLPVEAGKRRSTPLFVSDDAFTPLAASLADRLLAGLLSAVLPPPERVKFSWHSFRIGLACALLAKGAPPELIQAMCRWKSTQSLIIYARLNPETYGSWVMKAHTATVSSIQTANLPAFDDAACAAILAQLADSEGN